MRSALGNFVVLQACWFCCVLGGARGWPWLGPAAVAACLAAYMAGSPAPAREASLAACAGLLGILLDSALAAAGVLRFPPDAPQIGLVPVWMIALWMIFATTLYTSMRWMAGRYALGSLIGAAAGPLSYLGGARLGAVELGPSPDAALAVVALEWAVAMPALLALEAWLTQCRTSPFSGSAT